MAGENQDGGLKGAGLDVAFPLLWPRVVLAVGATAVALLAPLWWVPLLWLGPLWVLWRVRLRDDDVSLLRSGLWLGGLLFLATLVVTPLWLVVLAGVAWVQAVQVAAALAVRLLAVFLVGFAFTAWVKPASWLASLRSFPRLGLLLTLTLRQLPEFAQDSVRLRAAQQGRGLLVGHRRWRPFVFLVPLFSRAFERSDRISMALILSGWGQGKARPVRRPRLQAVDPVLALGGLALAAVAVLGYLL